MNNKELIVLGIDSSCSVGSVGLSRGNYPIGELTLDISAKSSEKIIPSIEFLLNQAGIKPSEIDLVTVAIGPGSYTGLRVGLSTAKGICLANNIPICAVNTLHALSARLPLAFFPVAPILDAHAKLVYSALYKWGEESIVSKARKLDEFIEMLPQDIVIFTGIDLHKFEDRIKEIRGETAVFAHEWVRTPSALVLCYMGLKKYETKDFDDIDSLTPEYLRDFMPNSGR